MPITTREVTSIASFVRALSLDKKDNGEIFWFRGQSEAEWPLLPGYLRLKSAPPEATLLNQFRQSAAMLAEFTPQESFDWLMLMQHYGVPTRLLDWSESPMIALYFALANRDNHKGKDAALWLLKPSTMNRNANIDDENDRNYIPSFLDEEPKAYTIEYLKNAPKSQLFPIAAIAVRNNTRIQAQSGVFTIHHLKNNPIEEIGDRSHVIKYIIPHERKDILANQLEILGLSKFHVFPELSTIGGMIKDRYK